MALPRSFRVWDSERESQVNSPVVYCMAVTDWLLRFEMFGADISDLLTIILGQKNVRA